MTWFEALVLGIVQGLTEFLPISSSAHILVLSRIFGWGDPGAAFTAVTQIGTEAAFVDGCFQVLVRGTNQIEIDLDRHAAADGYDFTFLQHTQQAGLC